METNLYPPWIPLVFTCTAREMVMFSQASVSHSVHGDRGGYPLYQPLSRVGIFVPGPLWGSGYVQRVGTHSPPPGLLRPTYGHHAGAMHPIGTLSFF